MVVSPEEHRAYMRAYYASRVQEAKNILGGVCSVCGTTEDLEFDHVDPSTKLGTITILLNGARWRWLTELEKCQLLCKEHHLAKTIAEGSLAHGKGPRKQTVMATFNCAECDGHNVRAASKIRYSTKIGARLFCNLSCAVKYNNRLRNGRLVPSGRQLASKTRPSVKR